LQWQPGSRNQPCAQRAEQARTRHRGTRPGRRASAARTAG
jgi:hypothetical protein